MITLISRWKREASGLVVVKEGVLHATENSAAFVNFSASQGGGGYRGLEDGARGVLPHQRQLNMGFRSS